MDRERRNKLKLTNFTDHPAGYPPGPASITPPKSAGQSTAA
ncbi:MAG: hypothetical protein ACK56I_08310 [bacterium]